MRFVIANWKMNPDSFSEAKNLFLSINEKLTGIKDIKVVVCPPFVYLSKLKENKTKIELGAQNCFWEKNGAYTGEISVQMLKYVGCQYVILGHSERRKYFKESNQEIAKKLKAVTDANLIPVLCIGETVEEKERGTTVKVLENQVFSALYGLEKLGEVFLIAYEPVWAIGTGISCGIEEAGQTRLEIKKSLLKLFNNKEIDKNFYFLYGGSVNSGNSQDYLEKAGFDGLLVGGASLNPEEFGKIIKSAQY